MLTVRHAPARQRGLSLVELLVGVAVGLLLLVGLSSVYVSTAKGGRTTTQVNQLSQEMRAVMDIMVNDIRRAGYWGAPAVGVKNPFTEAATLPTIVQSGDLGCILYAYDATYIGGAPGVVDAKVDFFGFRLDNGIIWIATPGTLGSTVAAGCGNTGGWTGLTDERGVKVTKLIFDTIGSKCIALDPAEYDPTEVKEPPDTFKYWLTTSGTGPACDPAAPGAPASPPHQFIETRQVNIRLVAESRTDPTLPALELRESVLIRNNRVILP